MGARDGYSARRWMPAMGPADLVSARLERAGFRCNRRDPLGGPSWHPRLDRLASYHYRLTCHPVRYPYLWSYAPLNAQKFLSYIECAPTTTREVLYQTDGCKRKHQLLTAVHPGRKASNQ